MNPNDNVPTSVLLAYARQRIIGAGLSGLVYAGVFIQVSQDAPMLEIDQRHPAWFSLAADGRTRVEANAVTVCDELAWFDCRKHVEVDRTIDLFVQTYQASPQQSTKGAA